MSIWRAWFLGDNIISHTNYQIMRHETDMNVILKGRFYNNQK